MGLTELVRRAIGRVVRWSMRQPRLRFATCGPHTRIDPNARIIRPQRLFLGDYVWIGGYCTLNATGGIRIGDNTIFGPFIHIYSSNHRYNDSNALPYGSDEYAEPVDIGANVWIGGDAVIPPGVTIGEGAVVAAGSVVVRDVPAGAVVGGAPAKVLRERDQDHYDRLKREGRFVGRLFGLPGTFEPEFHGGIPAAWYREAGLTVPPNAIEDPPEAAGAGKTQ